MIGRTNCTTGTTQSDIKNPWASVRIIAPIGSEVSATNGIKAKNLIASELDYSTLTHSVYILLINAEDFGTWTIMVTHDNRNQSKTITIHSFNTYEMRFNILVPDIYQEVEYLQANAGPWLDPEWLLDNEYLTSSCVKTAYLLTAIETTGRHIFGSWIGAGSSANPYYRSFLIFIINSSNTTRREHYIGGPNCTGAQTTSSANVKYFSTMSINQNIVTINSISATGTQAALSGERITGLDTGRNIPLFAARDASNNIVTLAKARIYYFLVEKNGILVKNLIPCYRKSDNVAGMYDDVSLSFYTNLGTGSFTVGPTIL